MLTLLVTAAISMSGVMETAFALENDEPNDSTNGDDFDGDIGIENNRGNPTCTDITLPTGGKNISLMTSKHCISDYGAIGGQNNTNSRDTNETGDNLSRESLKIPGKTE